MNPLAPLLSFLLLHLPLIFGVSIEEETPKRAFIVGFYCLTGIRIEISGLMPRAAGLRTGIFSSHFGFCKSFYRLKKRFSAAWENNLQKNKCFLVTLKPHFEPSVPNGTKKHGDVPSFEWHIAVWLMWLLSFGGEITSCRPCRPCRGHPSAFRACLLSCRR